MTSSGEYYGKLAYETYCSCVGGKAYNGDPLPTWEEQRAREDQKIPDAWVEAAEVVRAAGNP